MKTQIQLQNAVPMTEDQVGESVTRILAYNTLYSCLDHQKDQPFGLSVCGETTQTFWFATYQERNAVADTLKALGLPLVGK